ncbi:MAG: hypothetical protein NZ901_10640 [Geminocystis sp.]|nr:hypothetical protein [Geminocystis sp.]
MDYVVERLLAGDYGRAISLLEGRMGEGVALRADYYALALAYSLAGEEETAQSIWMSLLLEAEDFQRELDAIVSFIDGIGRGILKRGSLQTALRVYTILEELLSNREGEREEDAVYYHRIGLAAELAADFPRMERCYLKAIQLGRIVDSCERLGKLYLLWGMTEKAIEVFRKEVSYSPHGYAGYLNLFAAYHKSGRIKEAIEIAEEAERKCPDYSLLWKIRKYLVLPPLYHSREEMEYYRQRYVEGLNRLTEEVAKLDLNNPEVRQKAFECFRCNVNFELAYQRFNHRNLQKQYGDLLARVLAANYPDWVKPKPKKPVVNRKIRVGYVSECMCRHVVARLTSGWLRHHNRDKFEIYSYYIGTTYDEVTRVYEENSHFFYHIDGFEDVCHQILQDDLDILVLIEIGMSSQMAFLGSLRLAPVQCTTWAHPETSGLSQVDYFLSSDLMEPENAQEHYTEKLIRLPNIGVSFQKPPLPENPKGRDYFGLPQDSIIFFCGQSIFKYLPENDYLLANIASQIPNSKFVFISRPNPELASQFQQRLGKAFQELGLDIQDYTTFLPQLGTDEYLSLNLACDIFLDSLGWSGGGTTLEALACSLPVVTMPGEFMRGRHSYAILTMLGVTETIASSPQEYVDIAVRLATDNHWRREIREKIAQNHHRLYDDVECVRGLEQFYTQVVQSDGD